MGLNNSNRVDAKGQRAVAHRQQARGIQDPYDLRLFGQASAGSLN